MDYEFILGIPWLKSMNPYIDWAIREVIRREEGSESRRYKGRKEILPKSVLFLSMKSSHENSLLNVSTEAEAPKELPKEYIDFIDVFKKENAEILPPLRGHLDHHIELVPDAKPAISKVYNLSETEFQILHEYI